MPYGFWSIPNFGTAKHQKKSSLPENSLRPSRSAERESERAKEPFLPASSQKAVSFAIEKTAFSVLIEASIPFPLPWIKSYFLPTGLFFRPFSQNRSGGHSSFGFSVRSNFALVTFPVFAPRYFSRGGPLRVIWVVKGDVTKNQSGSNQSLPPAGR